MSIRLKGWGEYECFTLALIAFVFYWILQYFPFDGARFRAHDFLDNTFIYYVVRGREAWPFLDFDAQSRYVLDGLPISAMAIGDFSIFANLYYFFSPFNALAVSMLFLRVAAFISMYLLLRDYVVPRWTVVALVCAAAFAFQTHMPSRFGNVFLSPLFVWAVINIYNSVNIRASYFIVGVFPMFWMFIYGGYWYILLTLLFSLASVFVSRSAGGRVSIACLILIVSSAVFEYRFIAFVIDPPYHSFRDDVASISGLSDPYEIAQGFIRHFVFNANTHHIGGQWPVLIGVVAVAFFVGASMRASDSRWFKLLGALLAVAAAISLAHVWLLELGLRYRIDRVDVFRALVWHATGAVALVILMRWRRVFGVLAAVGLLTFSALQPLHGFKAAIATAVGAPRSVPWPTLVLGLARGGTFSEETVRYYVRDLSPSVREYFQVDVFSDFEISIDRHLAASEFYLTASVGIPPEVVIFNGYASINGYFFNHGSDYSSGLGELFRSDVEPRKRLYAPIPQVTADGSYEIDWDFCRFRRAGGRLVFSARPIADPDVDGLVLIAHSSDAHPFPADTVTVDEQLTYREIYVYDVGLGTEADCRYAPPNFDHRL